MRTKLLKIFTVVLMAATALGSVAQEFSVGDLMYKVYGSSVYCTGLTSAARGKPNLSVIIPSSVAYNGTTYRVNGVNANSFKNCTNIIGVSMRFGTAFIENNAFEGCTAMTYVHLPSSLKSIYSNAFLGCTALTTVYYAGFTFPMSGVYSNAFPTKSGMYLYIPYQSRKTPAEYKARTGFTQFTNVSYSNAAFDIWWVDGGTYCIGWPDNDGASVIRSATLTGYISTSDTNTSGGTLYKPTYHTYSGDGLSFEIDTIGADAFQGQSNLKTIDLTALTKLKCFGSQYQNTGVQNVTRLVLPNSNFSLTANSFLWFNSLAAFELASGSNSYSIYDGCLYNKSQTFLYKVPDAKSGSMSYPSTLTTVWNWSHGNCSLITDAILPYGVKTINTGAFANTASLDYVRIPSSVTSLSNDRVFNGTKSNNYIYCNMANPPTVTPSIYFGTHSNMHLYIPYGKESTYSNAGWTGFKYVNYDGRQAYDYPNTRPYANSYYYSVTSNASVTGADGNSYGGRARLVCNGATGYNDGPTSITIPASVSISGKTYVVNKIGEDAFNNHTAGFTVAGCVNIDTIGAYAFQNQLVTSYAFTHKLKYIEDYAFDGASLSGTVALPYGVSSLGRCAFGNGKYSRLVVPGSVSSWYGSFCKGTTTLTELVLNKNTTAFITFTGFDFTGVPATCKILVPTGVVNHYKQNSAFSSRASYISAGAYDYAYSNNYNNGSYFLTITSTSSTTYNGTTYDGTAKYVYHPNIKTYSSASNYGFATYEYDKTVNSDQRKYLITEIGDSLLYGCKYTGGPIPATVKRIGQSAFRSSDYAVNNLVLPSGLTFIGHDAFYNSKITGEVKIPSSVTTIEEYAFNTSTLSSLFFPDAAPAMGKYVWHSGIGTVWVPNGNANNYLTKANSWGTAYGDKLAPWIKPYAATQMFSSVLPVNLSGSNVSAYYASDYTKSDNGKEVRLTKLNQAPPSTGMLLVDLTVDKETRISRPTTSVSAPATNYLVATPSASVNVYSQTVGYYWEYRTPGNLRFVRPTSSYNTAAGGAYLKLSSSEASGKNEVYTTLYPKASGGVPGDVNGDGVVTAADITALYDVLLNNNYSHVVNGDQTGDGNITAADVTAVYTVMLGGGH